MFVMIMISAVTILTITVLAHTDHSHDPVAVGQTVRSSAGDNPWNQGQEPEDWWQACERMHGHVGPWNVLGWRIGKAALRELDATWGRHELDIVCYIPIATPYSCMADGLIIGTGNSLGRLDIRLAEVMSMNQIHIAVKRKDNTGDILVFKPKLDYMELIETRPVDELESLSRRCVTLNEKKIFNLERIKN